VCLGPIGYLVAHTEGKNKLPAISQLSTQLAGYHQQKMPLLAPVVGHIAGAICYHSHPHRPKLPGTPHSGTGSASVFFARYFNPIGNAKRQVVYVHGSALGWFLKAQQAVAYLLH
jgi:hypothetical protein